MFQGSLPESPQMMSMAANFEPEVGEMMMISGANTQPQQFHFESCP